MISVTSPTRVDLAGGTLDCWPLYLMTPGSVTVNLSIGISTSVELRELADATVRLTISDLDYDKSFPTLEECLICEDAELTLVRPHLNYWCPQKGFHLKTASQSPVGGGLGGSSSLCISLLKAFSQWLGRDLNVGEMVLIASNIEAQILKTPTGVQDYFPAAQPGLNVIELGVEGPKSSLVEFSAEEFDSQMLLVYTGKPHHSGINNWQVLKAAIEGDLSTLSCLQELAEIAGEMAQCCRERAWQRLAELFRREFSARTRLSPAFSSPEIERLERLVLQSGAEAVKICGAGGGGSVMVWVPPSQRAEVEKQCQQNGFHVLQTQVVG